MAALRSLLFNILFYLWTALVLILCLPFLLLPYAATYWFGRIWVRGTLFLLRHLTGLTHRVVGLEHARRGQAIYAAKHQSAWDTLIFALYLNKPAYVLNSGRYRSSRFQRTERRSPSLSAVKCSRLQRRMEAMPRE